MHNLKILPIQFPKTHPWLVAGRGLMALLSSKIWKTISRSSSMPPWMSTRHASNTIQKMFGMSKVVAERSADAKEAEVKSALPLQTSVSQPVAFCCLSGFKKNSVVCGYLELNNQSISNTVITEILVPAVCCFLFRVSIWCVVGVVFDRHQCGWSLPIDVISTNIQNTRSWSKLIWWCPEDTRSTRKIRWRMYEKSKKYVVEKPIRRRY